MAFSLIWLPDVLENAGLKVARVPGWKKRGVGNRDIGKIKGVLCHHTAGPIAGNMPSLGILRDGRQNLSGPLSQLGLGRDGTYYVIAAGKANHAGRGSWRDLMNNGNSHLIGIEGENTGKTNDFPWSEIQMDAYRRGVTAILGHLNLDKSACIGHKEWASSRKIDPLFDMNTFRLQVGMIIDGTAPPSVPIPGTDPEGRPTIRRGSKGEHVRVLQSMIGVSVDGKFGPQTESVVRAFQREHGLIPDGIVGPQTWAALQGAETGGITDRPVLRRSSTGAAVRYLQSNLGIPADGQFGPMTEAAVIGFQRARGLSPDGIVGPRTWAALDS